MFTIVASTSAVAATVRMFVVELSLDTDAEASDGNAPTNPIPPSIAAVPVTNWRRVAAGLAA